MAKICKKCEIEKPLEEFELRKDTGKYRNVCKKCVNLRHKKLIIDERRCFIWI